MGTSLGRAEETLREQATLLLNAQRLAHMGSWALDVRTGALQWSEATCELFGIAPGQFRGTFEHFMSFVLPEDVPAYEAARSRLSRESPLFEVEYRIRRPDGAVRSMIERGNASFDAAGAMTACIGMVMDVTEQTRARHELAHSAMLARVASRTARVGGWTIDVPEMKLTWSDENCAIHEVPPGYQPTLEEGIALFPPEHREYVARLVRECAHSGTPYEFELPKYTARGRRIWVRSMGEAVRDARGNIVRLQGAFQDITERKLAEQALRDKDDQLRQALRLESVGRLTGGLAHDFNNLLTVILGNAEMLSEALEGHPQLGSLAHVVVEAAQRGADLTQRLLAFARRQALEPRAVDINRRVADMDAILKRTLGAHIHVEFATACDLWPALVDPAQLDNTLLNLSLNARDAMPQGGSLVIETANVRLDVGAAPLRSDMSEGEYVMVAVADTGRGIEPEHLGRVFEPFFTTKDKGKGTGLGLAMVYGFVTQSGGHVKIDSAPGRGTTVRLYLPRAADNAARDGPTARRGDAVGGAETVLLVEDDEMVRRHAHAQLISLGYTVLQASDGARALEILRGEQAVDLLFTDVVMPGMGGRELAARARALRPQLAVLYTSGYAEDAIVLREHLEAGVQLLAKPYRRDELARRLRLALDT